MIFYSVLGIAIVLTILGIVYLFTIGRLTDVIPILGFGDDVVVVFVVLFSWLVVILSSFLESPRGIAFIIIVVLTVLEIKTGFMSKIIDRK